MVDSKGQVKNNKLGKYSDSDIVYEENETNDVGEGSGYVTYNLGEVGQAKSEGCP